jgi:hypothetical protein
MSNPKRFIAIVIVTIGLVTVVSQIAVVMTVNGMVGYGQVKAVSSVMMPTASSQNVHPSLFSQASLDGLRTGRAELPPLEDRLMATGDLFLATNASSPSGEYGGLSGTAAPTQLGS